MFSILRAISKSNGFRHFIQEYIGQNDYLEQQTHGVRLALDEYWLDWWCFLHLRLFSHLFPGLVGHVVRHRGRSWGPRLLALLSAMGFPYPSREDLLGRAPPGWDRYCAARGWRRGATPIRVILSLRPGTSMNELERPEQTAWVYPIEFEVRPLVRGQAHHRPTSPLIGGVSLGPGGGTRVESGTLGGIVRSGGASLAVTCAHVIGGLPGAEVWHPAASDHRASVRIGTVRSVVAPTPRRSPVCNRTQSYAASSDVAVVSIDSSLDTDLAIRKAGQVRSCRPIEEIGCYEDVVFVGKESDRREARTEQISHWQEITIEGVPHCYQDLFTIGFRRATYFSQNLSVQGDSGSWILSDAGLGGHDLLGILVGGEGEKAFCCFAENSLRDAGLDSRELLFR